MAKNNPEREKAWKMFSRLRRIQGCLETTGLAFVGICITCNRRFHIKVFDAGHAISGRRNTVLLNKRLVHPQCRIWCNHIQHGDQKKYRGILIKRYGQKWWDRVFALSKKTIPDKCINWVARAARYKRQYEKLIGMSWEGMMKI